MFFFFSAHVFASFSAVQIYDLSYSLDYEFLDETSIRSSEQFSETPRVKLIKRKI